MKNRELIWTREQAGFTQAAAADAMGVHRVTFVQWESGARPIPERKWQAFLKIAAVNPLSIPKFAAPPTLQYDAEGYPVGFDCALYEEMMWDIASYTTPDGEVTCDDGFGGDMHEAALK